MGNNFQDNVAYGGSTLSVSGNAVQIGNGAAGAKSIIMTNNNGAGHIAWDPGANRTISLPDAGGVVLLSSQGILSISAGGNTVSSGQLVFSNSNGVSFGINGQTLTGSHNGITSQTNQSIGLYGLGNTTQNSSTTLDARSLSFNGLGGATVGYSNGSIQISAPTTANLISRINLSAGTTSNNLTNFVLSNSNGVSFGLNGSTITASVQAGAAAGIGAVGAGTQTQTSGTLIFSNANGITFGMSNSSVITASYTVPGGGGGGDVNYYAVGNTTQNSSSVLSNTISFNAIGAMTMGYSNGSIQVSAPSASQLVGVGGISLSTDGNTISISNVGPNRSFIEIMNGERMTSCAVFSETALSNRVMLYPFWMDGQGIEPKTVRFLVSGIASSNRSLGGTYAVGLYSAVNSTQLSLFGSDSMSYSITASSQSTVWNGLRAMDFTGITGTMTREGRWAIAFLIRNVSNNTAWANVQLMGGDNFAGQFSGYLVGNTSSATNSQSQILPFWGCYNTTSSNFPSSIGLTQINGNNSQSVRDAYCVIKNI